MDAKSEILSLLDLAGINVNGNNPWDIKITHPDFFPRILKHGSLGLGEAFMDKWWECDRIDQFFERIINAKLENKIKTNKLLLLKLLMLRLFNHQTKERALEVGIKHYDLGNDLFTAMLDKRMVYTCGYWKDANNLNDAQHAKLELSCQKLMLKPGMTVLDIGCGFGSFAKYAAENFGVNVVGITISQEQYDYAVMNCKNLPVEIRIQDYRDVNEKFDRIVSLGMFEHVGHKNYHAYMRMVYKCLKNDGLFLLHTIGSNLSEVSGDEWLTKYIFPNGMLPSISQIGKSSEDVFIMEDWHNFGSDYDKTALAWLDNFNTHWDDLKNKYDDRFYRMWTYYLLSCAGTFRARRAQLWQIVFSKQGVKGGYFSPRFGIDPRDL